MEDRHPYISRSLPGEHSTHLPASLPPTSVSVSPSLSPSLSPNPALAVLPIPSSQVDDYFKARRTRRSLSTSSSSQSLLKRSLSPKPRAHSGLYPPSVYPGTPESENNSQRSSFEDFDYSTSGTPFNSVPTGSSQLINTPSYLPHHP